MIGGSVRSSLSPQYTVASLQITLKSQAPCPLENVVLSVVSSPPLMCNRSSIVFPVIGESQAVGFISFKLRF